MMRDEIKNFYSLNRTHLEKAYPGITCHGLSCEIEDNIGHSILPMALKKIFCQLQEGVSLPYIFNRAYFYHSEFLIDRQTFIPRPETEQLVEMSICELRKLCVDRPCIADIGTGSGAIFLSILQDIDDPVRVFAVDICNQALKMAQVNTYRLKYTIHPETSIEFIKLDRLMNTDSGLDLGWPKLDLIVSNPPYIKKREDFDLVHEQVRHYGPHVALFLEDDEYGHWYKAFFEQARKVLSHEGIFLMEGHENHLQELKILALEVGFEEVEVCKDYTQRDRYLKVKNCKKAYNG